MFKKVAFTMYPVEDLARARQFYEKTLGLTVGKTYIEDTWVEYDLPSGGCFVLTSVAKDMKPSEHYGGVVAFEVEDLETLMARLKKENVQVKLDIFHSPVCQMSVIYDSEGNLVTLHQCHSKKE